MFTRFSKNSLHNLAALCVAAASLAKNSLAVAILLEEADQRSHDVDVVLVRTISAMPSGRHACETYGGAVGMRAAVITIEVLVD